MEASFEVLPFGELDPATLHAVLKLRSDVFLLEQGLTAEADIDGLDPEAEHVVGRRADGVVVATARLRPTPDGATKVERVVVARKARGRGLGRALMTYVQARLGGTRAVLSAQAPLVPWYESMGWKAVGEPYVEATVPHRRMIREGAQAT